MNAIQSSRFLKNAFLADAAATGALAVLHLARPEGILGPLALPEPLLQGTGLFMAGYVLMLLALAACRNLWRPLVLFVVVGNVLWALASIDIVVLGLVAPSALGVAYVILQALGTLGLAWLQYLGLQKSPAAAPARTVAAM
jgi:hypothetical protein